MANGDLFEIEYRGLTAVKGKEDMLHTYWLLGMKTERMVCEAGAEPELKRESGEGLLKVRTEKAENNFQKVDKNRAEIAGK